MASQRTSPPASGALVLVHPGSACGSADFHHGRRAATAARQAIADLLLSWDGDLVVVDSDLSDEIDGSPPLAAAIDGALAANAERGWRTVRLRACDAGDERDGGNWVAEVRDHVLGLSVRRVVITGAWYHPDDDGGCVNAVYDALDARGLSLDVDDSAISIDID
jgi:hypothetical protein